MISQQDHFHLLVAFQSIWNPITENCSIIDEQQPVLEANQGDHIERTFANWAIFFFWRFYEKYSSTRKIWATFFQGKSYILI
jgi:hypothetical protein